MVARSDRGRGRPPAATLRSKRHPDCQRPLPVACVCRRRSPVQPRNRSREECYANAFIQLKTPELNQRKQSDETNETWDCLPERERFTDEHQPTRLSPIHTSSDRVWALPTRASLMNCWKTQCVVIVPGLKKGAFMFGKYSTQLHSAMPRGLRKRVVGASWKAPEAGLPDRRRNRHDADE